MTHPARQAPVCREAADSTASVPRLLATLFRTLHRIPRCRWELRLATAVLEDAVHSLEMSRNAVDFQRRLLRWETEEWFRSTDCAPLFSFERICLLLGLRAESIREVALGGEGARRFRGTASPEERERKAVHPDRDRILSFLSSSEY